MTEAHPDIAALSFEQALAELEQIVQKLESGRAELDESIALYTRGTALKAHCEAKLSAAEARLEKVIKGPQGPTSEPMDLT